MASDKKFVLYVVDQCGHDGEVDARPMFGEYGLYLRGKLVALVCDNRLLVKPTPGGRAFIGEIREDLPYPGAKPAFLIDEKLDDREFVSELLEITFRELPEPQPKRARRSAAPKAAQGRASGRTTK